MEKLVTAINVLLIPMIGVCISYRLRKRKLFWDEDLPIWYSVAVFGNYLISKVLAVIASKIICSEVKPDMKKYTIVALVGAVVVLPIMPELLSHILKKMKNAGKNACIFSNSNNSSSNSDFAPDAKVLVKKSVEFYFLFVIAFVSFGMQIGLTTFYFWISYYVIRHVYIITAFVTLIKAASNYKNRTLWLSLVLATVFYFAFPFENYNYQAFYAFLIVGCVGVNIRKIFCAAFIPATVVILNMILASFGGALNSMAYWARGIRSCWGHIYPTDFGTAVICIVVFMWLMLRDVREEVFIIPALLSLWISKYITRSFTSEYVTVLFIVILICRVFERKLWEGECSKSENGVTIFVAKADLNVKNRQTKRNYIKKTVDILLMSAFPILACITVVAAYAYYKEVSFAGALDTLFHGRLVYPARMYEKYGLKPFGTYFGMIGFGGSTFADNAEYNFLDSSYPQILIRYGWVTFITANVSWMYTTWKAIKSGNRRLAYAMALFATDFVMEHHWYELSYNVFILIPFADFAVNGVKDWRCIRGFRERWKDKKYAVVFAVSALFLLGCVFVALPILFSWLRTIFNGYNIHGGGMTGIKVFILATVILATFFCFIWSSSSISAEYIKTRGVRKTELILFGTTLFVAMCGIVIGNSLINRVVSDNQERINEEREIINLIVTEADGKVYVDKLPEAYIRITGEEGSSGIARAYFNGEDYARLDDTTVIVDASWDSQCFSGMGFLYLQISDQDGIYTNDEGVIAALKEKGYVLKGYNSYEHQVDMKAMADWNQLEMTDDCGLRLDGAEHQIIHGPYVDLYSGKYTVKFEMKLDAETVCKNTNSNEYSETGMSSKTDADKSKTIGDDLEAESGVVIPDSDRRICRIRVASYYGAQEKSNTELYRKDFDDEGKLSYEVTFSGGGRGYEFLVFTDEGVRCEVESISYRRTPDADIHRKVDDEGRTLRAEYFDEEGNPKEMAKGYYGMEYAYDSRDLKVMERYLGSDFRPVITDNGYAEMRREYNIRKQLVKESYYGVDGEPIALSGGQHIVEKVPDFYGNVTEESYFGIDGKPVMLDDAYACIKRTFDEKKRWLRTEYYDTDGKLVLQNKGYAIIEREYDDDGNVTMERYLGLNSEPVIYNEAYHEVRKRYDDKKNCIEERYYDVDSEPLLIKGGYAGCRREYDDVGNVIRYTYLGVDGEPTISDAGYAIWRRIYNSKKQVSRQEYYDVDDNKMLRPSGQFAEEYEYDDAGNRIEVRYYGIDDEKVLIQGGYWKITFAYDDSKRNIREEYCGIDGEPILIKGGYAGCKRKYDDVGNVIHYTYLGVNGEPTIADSGYAIWHRSYNSKKQISRQEYYDINDNKMLLPAGQFAEEYEYDDAGNRIEVRYYGIDDEKVLIQGGYWKITFAYDDNKKKIREEYYDTEGEPGKAGEDFILTEFEYDDSGKLVKRVYKDASGNDVKEQDVE